MHSRRTILQSLKSCRRGAAAVEFAVVAPLFMLLLAGIIEFGQAFRIEHMISMAGRRGARAAIVDKADAKKVEKNIKQYCAKTLGVKEGDVTVDIAVNGDTEFDLKTAEEGDEIAVTVSLDYAKAGAGFYAHLFSNATLTTTCMLEHE